LRVKQGANLDKWEIYEIMEETVRQLQEQVKTLEKRIKYLENQEFSRNWNENMQRKCKIKERK